MKRTIKGIRCDLGYTQEEFAKVIGIKVNKYKSIERGESVIPAFVAFKVLEIAHIDNYKDLTINK